MQPSRHYEHPPITEAIIDLRVALPSDTSLETLNGLHDLVRERYPTQQPIVTGMLSLQAAPVWQVGASQRQEGFLFRSDDGVRVFQATLGGFTYNRLAPYSTWAEFRTEAKALWDIYRAVCKPAVALRAAVRFINRIELPGPAVDFKEYLRTTPEVAPDLPQDLSSYFMQLQIPQEDLQCMLIITEAFVPPPGPQTIPVILDIDLFREQMWQADDEDIWRFLEQLRGRKNLVFESSITDKTRELFN